MTRLLPEGECSAEQSTEDCDKVGAPLKKRWAKKMIRKETKWKTVSRCQMSVARGDAHVDAVKKIKFLRLICAEGLQVFRYAESIIET